VPAEAPADGAVPDEAAGEDEPSDDADLYGAEEEYEEEPPPAEPTHSEHPVASYMLRVNGADRPVTDAWLGESLLYVLRERLGLAGAKDGCEQGECGACSVQVDGRLVASCLVPAATAAGSEVRTVEGLSADGGPCAIQRALADCGAVQCGFCIPGMAMTVHDLLEGNHRPTDLETRHALSGNLCRCTGYRPIKDAADALGHPDPEDALAGRRTTPAPAAVPTRLHDAEARFVRPTDLQQALTILAEEPETTVVAGSTDWGVDVNLKGARARLVLAIDRLEALRGWTVGDDEVRIGAALTLSEIERRLDGRLPLLAALFPQFASRLIRNGATLGGNLGTGSPIGDAPPVLLALEAGVVLASTEGERTVPLAEYFTGYRESVRQPGELITEVVVPLPAATTTAFHKIAKRPFDDISSVAVAFALGIDDGTVRPARIGLGGVAATPIRALATEAALEGTAWNDDTVEAAAHVLAGEGTPIDDQRASARFRAEMLGNSLRKLFHSPGLVTGLRPSSTGGEPS
jgi:xanthine dehydrogenase small subunit